MGIVHQLADGFGGVAQAEGKFICGQRGFHARGHRLIGGGQLPGQHRPRRCVAEVAGRGFFRQPDFLTPEQPRARHAQQAQHNPFYNSRTHKTCSINISQHCHSGDDGSDSAASLRERRSFGGYRPPLQSSNFHFPSSLSQNQSGGKTLKLSMTACGGDTVTVPSAALVRVVSRRTTARVAISAATW